MKRTKGPWRWLSKETLVGDHGYRPVIISANRKGQFVQRSEEGLLRPIDTMHPDMRALAGAGRLIEAVEAFFKLRTSIFPEVRGPEECAALEELEESLRAAGGRVPYDPETPRSIKEFVKRGMDLEDQGLDPGPIGNPKKKPC